MTKDLIERLEARLRLAEQHGPICEGREIYIPSSDLPQIISALRSLTGEGEPVAWRARNYTEEAWTLLSDRGHLHPYRRVEALYTRPVACPDRPALDIPALQREVAGIIVRDVLQEEYDDLVEGYLDEIMRASLRIIRLPGYSVVARAFETNLADAILSGGAE